MTMNKFSPDVFESKDLPFEVNRLSPTIGGEILGVDLSKSLTKELKDLIYEALLVYLSLIHISEPTRRTPISYAVF